MLTIVDKKDYLFAVEAVSFLMDGDPQPDTLQYKLLQLVAEELDRYEEHHYPAGEVK